MGGLPVAPGVDVAYGREKATKRHVASTEAREQLKMWEKFPHPEIAVGRLGGGG